MKEKSCIFCKIVNREIISNIVYEDQHLLAFLDKRPLFLGHSLIIPKLHYATFYDLPASLLSALMQKTQALGRSIEQATNAEGSFIATNSRVSQSVPHVHFHVVPRKQHDGLKGFFWPRNNYSEQENLQIQKAIIQQMKTTERKPKE